MVFGEATTTFPIIASDALHRRKWAGRPERRFNEKLGAVLAAKA
jgi:hypothetical protein